MRREHRLTDVTILNRLTLTDAASTVMGCPLDRTAQEAWITDALRNEAAMSRAGDAYTVSGGDVTLTLAPS